MRLLTLLLTLLSLVSLHANDAEDIRKHFPSSSLANTDGLINSIVDGKVSAITGDFIEYQPDLVIDGPEPLVLSRYYSGNHCECLGISWDLSIPLPASVKSTSFRLEKNEGTTDTKKDGYLIYLREASGGAHLYGGIIKKEGFIESTLLMPGISDGFTNCGYGRPSGKTNPMNNSIRYNEHSKKRFEVTTGAGDVRYYKSIGQGNFHIVEDWKANGCKFNYSYKKHALSQIEASDVTGCKYALLDFKVPQDGFTIEGSNGDKVTYRFAKHDIGKDTKASYLSSVKSNHAPNTYYKYTKRDNNYYLISEKTVGVNHCAPNKLYIDYYEKGKNQLGNQTIKIKGKHDPRIDRIKSIKNPYGTTYEFAYQLSDDETACCATDVYDAAGNRTKFTYNKETQRLHSIESFAGKEAFPVLKQKFDWSEGGLLIAKTDMNAQGQSLRKVLFGYDKNYNIINEILEGDLEGWNTVSAYGRWFKYSEDGYNNLIAEGDHEGPTIEYNYLPYTDLPTARYVICDDHITLREFKFYDEHRLCIQEFYDNGSSRDYNDLTDVTERIIVKRLVSYEPHLLGKPLVESQYYLEDHQEKLLKTLVYTYDEKGRVIKQDLFDSEGAFCYALEKRYNSQDKVIWENDPFGHTTERTYDIYGNVLTECGPDKRYTQVTIYDAICRPVSHQRVESNGTTYTSHIHYNQLNQIVSTIDELGRHSHFRYDALGRCIEHLKPLTIVGEEDNIATLNADWCEYDPLGNLILHRSNDGSVVTQRYTVRGDLTEKNYPDGSFEKWIYSPGGRLLCHRDRLGVTVIYAYDRLGNKIREEIIGNDNQSMGVTTYLWRGKRLMQVTDAIGNTHSYKYDGAGRLVEEQDADTITRYTYDSLGRRCEESIWSIHGDKPLAITYTKYDFADRVIEEGCLTGDRKVLKKQQHTYDAVGNEIASTQWSSEQDAAVTLTDYDTFGRAVKIVDPTGLITHISYTIEKDPHSDALVWVVTTTDPTGRQAKEKRDALDRVKELSIHDAFGSLLFKQVTTYDLAGRRSKCIVSVIEEGTETGQQVYVWRYNNCGDLIEEISAWKTPEQRSVCHSYAPGSVKTCTTKADGNCIYSTYDNKGRLSTIADSQGTLSYTYDYDIFDQLITVHDNIEKTYIKRDYDKNGNLVQEAFDKNLTLKFDYNSLDQLKGITYPDGSTACYEYESTRLVALARHTPDGQERYRHTINKRDLFGNPLAITLPGKAGKLLKTYDREGRVLEIISTTFQQFLKERDKEYKPLKIQYVTPDATWADNFTYDAKGNLNSEKSFQYCYDSLGNRTRVNDHHWIHNQQNQLLATYDAAYIYDANGNLISDGVNQYKYDGFNRLIQVQTPNEKVEYVYDNFHRRLQKRTGQNTEHYAYIGNNEIGAYTSEDFKNLRILAGGLGAEIGATVSIECNGNYYIPIHDHRGSIRSLVNGQTGQEEATFCYSAFGQLLAEEGNTSLCPWRFSSKRYDSETGFTYFGERYYNPSLGRWTTLDPEGFDENPNGYVYVNNRPHCQIDLYGRFSHLLSVSSISHVRPMNPSSVKGICHGTTDFCINTWHAFERGLAYVGAAHTDLDHDFFHKSAMFSSIVESQAFNKAAFDHSYMRAMGVDHSDTTYQSWRKMTSTGLEVSSLALGGWSIAKSLYSATKLASFWRSTMTASETLCAESSIARNCTRISSQVESSIAKNTFNHGAENVNAADALITKMRQIQNTPGKADITRILPDGRIRYYGSFRESDKPGSTCGARYVTEYNPSNGKTRSWHECYDKFGNVVRIHPKTALLHNSPHVKFEIACK